MWGGFAVDNATLNRFYSLHFLVPFLALSLVVIHLFFLHQAGSSNPLGVSSNYDKIPFHPYFSTKDLLGFNMVMVGLMATVFYAPWALGDPENFIAANPLVTPLHIQPEWYFLFAYAILRSIPNKLGGVVALVASVAILWVMPFLPKSKFKRNRFYPTLKYLHWYFVALILLLMWIGARPVESPYINVGQLLTFLYFLYFSLLRWKGQTRDWLLS
jgi:ubiquinol-cytochrome c reductase cytochrome b subunit